jgi:hypothetical protein
MAFSRTYVAIRKVKIQLENHPLLLKFESELECKIKGKPENLNEFIGEN